MFLHEHIDKLDAVKFSLIDLPAKKSKNIRFLFLSLRNGKTNDLFYFYVNNYVNKSKLRHWSNGNIYIWSIFENIFWGLLPSRLCFRENIFNSRVVCYRLFSIPVKRYSSPPSRRHACHIFN